MAFTEINVTSFDHNSLKQELIQYLEASGKFDNFDFEGSTINTIIDLLVRNSEHDAFLANMLANESFIQSAQIRGNVSSHAQKLSYVPKTATASRMVIDVEVTPFDTNSIPNNIVMEAGTVFLASVGGNTYSFTNRQAYTLNFNSGRGTYKVTDVELFQGQLITNQFVHIPNTKLTIPNANCDSSTLTVTTSEGLVYREADDINELGVDSKVYFLSEDLSGRTRIEFGKNRLGNEPAENTTVTVQYVATEEVHANGAAAVNAASTIAGYSDIDATVTTVSYGGSEREDMEDIRFIAPKYHAMQNRALAGVDYAILLKKQFPFIKSAISWGGEDNDPVRYGDVLISIISDEGGLVTNSVKQQMIAYLKGKNVGSITPVIVEPESFGIDLTVSFAYDDRKTSKSFSGLTSDVVAVVNAYGDTLNEFDVYFNEPVLVRDVLAVKGVTTVDVEKVVFSDITTLRFNNPIYSVTFDNEIEEGSVLMEDFEVNAVGENHKLYDVNGLVYIEYTTSGEKTILEVGTVDYTTGTVEFTANFIQEADSMRLYVTPKEENFYIQGNKIVYLNTVTTNLLTERLRNGTVN